MIKLGISVPVSNKNTNPSLTDIDYKNTKHFYFPTSQETPSLQQTSSW